jgi:hypothetical protein
VANYGVAVYGESIYGQTNQIPNSVSPMFITVVYPTVVVVNWQPPSGTYSAIRLVRNQNSLPETAEDGVIVWEQLTTNSTKQSFNDGGGVEDTAGINIVSGKPIYYGMFLFTSDNIWVPAGAAYDIVPSSHGITNSLVRSLPRVFTSKEQSPIGEPDTTSDLYYFLDGVGFTLDESLTFLDLLLPDHTRINTPVTVLPLETENFGLTPEPGMSIKSQKQLVREALYMYTHKGTLNGLSTYVASLTNYTPTITTSSNLLLNVQDSTFYKSTGNWIATNATISSSTDEAPVPALTSKYIDLNYSCKIVASNAGYMTLGKDSPIFKGVPVTPGTQYTLSSQMISPASAGSIKPEIRFFDKNGVQIGNYYSPSTGTAATGTWNQISYTVTAPIYYKVVASSAVGASGTITYTTPVAHTFTVGEYVTISGFTTAGFNLSNVAITGVTGTTFTVSNSFTGTSLSNESGQVVPYTNNVNAAYASIGFSWSAAGTYYIDCVSMQVGATASYDEARAVDILLNPNKSNLIYNPSFETNATDNWTLTGAATVTTVSDIPSTVYSGSKSAKIVATGPWTFTSNKTTILPGKYYTGSAYVKSSSDILLTFIGRDINGNIVDNDPYPQGTFADWTRIYGTDLTDAVATTDTYEIVFSGNAGTFYIDSVQFENTFRFNPTNTPHFAPTDYIDGSLPSSVGCVWSGTVNNSPSYLYINKDSKVLALAKTLIDWLPENVFWRVRTYDAVEYTNLTV